VEGQLLETTRTDDKGRFRFQPVRPLSGLLQNGAVVASKTGHAWAARDLERLRFPDHPVEPVLLKMEKPRSLAGRVVDRRGRPVGGARVYITASELQISRNSI
jgi:hypothetical protein